VGAVEVGRAVAAAQVERVVAVVEETEPALFIEGVGPGIGDAGLDAVADALFNVGLKGVVGIDAGGSIGDGFRGITHVRHRRSSLPPSSLA